MKNVFESFTKCYQPTSKTLRFTLIPQGKTQENIDKLGVLQQDFERDKVYGTVKKVLDEAYQAFLEEALTDESMATIDWMPLFEAHEENRRGVAKKDDALDAERKKYPVYFLFCRELGK